MKAWRPIMLLAHRWFGIIAAVWLFVAGLTGAIMVFTDEIDQTLNADLFAASPGPSQSTDALVGAILATHPGHYVSSIDLPNAEGEVAIAYYRHAGPAAAGHNHGASTQVLVDPPTAVVLGERQRGSIDFSRRGLMDFVTKLHYTLQLGDVAKWLFGLVAFTWMLDHLVSAALSFPTAAKFKQSFQIRRGVGGPKRVFDLHRAVGLWLFPITFALAVSSVYLNLNWGTDFRVLVGTFSPLSSTYDARQPAVTNPDYRPPVGFQRAIEAATSKTGAVVDGVSFNPDKGLYRVRLFDERDVDPSVGRRYVYVDVNTGAIRADEHQLSGTSGDVVLGWQFPLHSGKAFGWTGRLVIFFTGLAICMFVVTGLLLWVRRAEARKAIEKKRSSGVQEPMPVAALSATE
jgi:uncharacterized iron-regulated membrane protein